MLWNTCALSCFSRVWLYATPWTVTCQAPPSMGLSRQEYWSGLPCTPPGDTPSPGIEPVCLLSPALADTFFTTGATWKAQQNTRITRWKTLYCNWAGAYGLVPHLLCFSCSLKYLDNSIWRTFLSCFPDVKTPHQVGDVNYLMTMSTQPPGLLEPKDYNVNR